MSYPAQDPEHQPWDDPEVWAKKLSEAREAILNIRMAIQVIAPLWEDMKRFGHGSADDLAGAQANLEQAIRFLTGEETPS